MKIERSHGTGLGRQVSAFGSLALVLLCGLGSAACSSLLDVEAPSRIEAETLEQSSNAELLVNSAISDFECALSEYIVGAGLLGDEFQDAQLASAMWPYDQRQWNPDTNGDYATATCDDGAIGIYTTLSTARWQADNALTKLEAWTDAEVPDRTALMAKAAAFAGYSYVLMGEGMCSAAFDDGPELSPSQVFALAEDRFTQALGYSSAAGLSDFVNLANVGRARARLDMGQAASAAEDARQVPLGFVFNATYSGSAPRRQNDIYTRNVRDGTISVEDDFRGLEWEGVPDPRVHVTYAGISTSDHVTEVWVQDKFLALGTPIPIASGDEAQLIIAEAAGGQTAVDIINSFHARAGLPQFASTDEALIREHIIQERSRELFLESHHLGDKHRYGLAFTPAAGTPYPPKAGGFYGSVYCFPLPQVETANNPNIR